MNLLQSLLHRLNNYQQKHHATAFAYAVIRKYSDDEAGRHAALLTYYGFLSLFPLLLVLTTVTDVIIGRHSEIGNTIIRGLTNYFPLLGNQLSLHVHDLHASGFALIVGILFTLYGTRGVADAFRHGVQDAWHVPQDQRIGFPLSLLKSLSLIIVGGVGFLLASIGAGLASSAGHGLVFRAFSIAVNLLILYILFNFLINFSLPRHVTFKETRLGAAVAAVGLVILQFLGSYILARELKSLDALYSYFAIALGLLFWIYLQAQLLYYAIEIATVSSKKLWPRSLETSLPTTVDTHLSR